MTGGVLDRVRASAAPLAAFALLLGQLAPASADDAPARAQAAAPDGGPRIRTSMDPAKPVIGQHVRLMVDVLFPDRMPAPPQVDMAQSPGLQVFRLESQGLTMRDTIDGEPFVGQRFEFALYPRRAGKLAIPPVQIRLMDRNGDVTGTAAGEAQTLTVSAPPGVDPTQPSIASTKVALTQTWERDAKQGPLHPGDVLTRVVKREADDTPALAFAAPDLGAPPGVRAYADQPQSNDRIERARLTGERTDRITYVFEKPGDYSLPEISQSWWDLSAGRLRRALGEGRKVTIVAAASPKPEETGGLFERLGRRGLIALSACAIIVALGGLGVAWLIEARRERLRRGPSPAALFSELKTAARSGDAPATYRAFAAWRAAADVDSAALAALPTMQAMERSLFAGEGGWSRQSGEALVAALENLRRGSSRPRRASALPPLNPS